mgnify:FL=1
MRPPEPARGARGESATPAIDAPIAELLARPLAQPDPEVVAAIEAGPIDPASALPRGGLDRLLDPRPLAGESGWCTLADGVGYVAVRTAMLGITGEMIDWWFDWHARDPLRYRAWHPAAHFGNSLEEPRHPAAKAHWGATHHPVEDVGTGRVRARIEFVAPTALGFSTDALDHPDVATIVCGWAGDDRRRVRHTMMAHVFLNQPDGVALRSRFWLGAALRPHLPLSTAGALLLNNRLVRRLALPAGLPRALATHCAEEYANLARILPGVHRRYGGASATTASRA